MLDVHILISKDTPEEWVSQCIDSVYVAANVAGFEVNVFPVDGIPGHIGKGRKLGYSKGSALYKTYVDDDDYVLPDIFMNLGSSLERGFAGIFTHETRLQNGVFIKSPSTHHLAVYRYDVLKDFPFDDWAAAGDVATKYIVQTHPDGIRTIPTFDYIHRVYPKSKADQLRREHGSEMMRALWQTY